MTLVNIITMISIVLVSFVLIIWRVYRTERLLATITTTRHGREIIRTSQVTGGEDRVEESHRNTKVVTLQALAYIGSFLFTLTFPFLRSFLNERTTTLHVLSRSQVTHLSIVFMPLQGFFNALIFISHKIYNYRRVNEDVSRLEVLKLLFRGSMDEPVLLSRISRIDILAGDEGAEVEVADEEGVEEMHFTINLNAKEGSSEAKSDDGDNFVDNNDESGVDQNLSLSQGLNQPSAGSNTLGGFSLFSFSQNSHRYSQRSNTPNNADNNIASSVGDEALSVAVSGFSNSKDLDLSLM